MGLKFRKSVKLAPGIKLNLTKNGVSSVSVGKNGAKVNIGKNGIRSTVGIPGSGLSYSSHSPRKKSTTPQQVQPTQGNQTLGLINLVIIVVCFIFILFMLLK